MIDEKSAKLVVIRLYLKLYEGMRLDSFMRLLYRDRIFVLSAIFENKCQDNAETVITIF